MRPIKFRGKRKDNGQWAYGYYIAYNFLNVLCHYIVEDFIDHCQLSDRLVEVDPDTVGQFTGLRDNKRTKEYPEGQEIYEGDRLRMVGNGNEYVVEYREAEAGYWPSLSMALSGYIAQEYEVIGNI